MKHFTKLYVSCYIITQNYSSTMSPINLFPLLALDDYLKLNETIIFRAYAVSSSALQGCRFYIQTSNIYIPFCLRWKKYRQTMSYK